MEKQAISKGYLALIFGVQFVVCVLLVVGVGYYAAANNRDLQEQIDDVTENWWAVQKELDGLYDNCQHNRTRKGEQNHYHLIIVT